MINNIDSVHQAMAQTALNKAKGVYHLPQNARLSDSVQLSNDVMRVRSANFNNARLDKINSIRRELENNTYVTPEKLDVALDRAIDDALRQIM